MKKIFPLLFKTREEDIDEVISSLSSLLEKASDKYLYNVVILHNGLSSNSVCKLNNYIKYDKVNIELFDDRKKSNEVLINNLSSYDFKLN